MRSPLFRLALCCTLSLALGAHALVAHAQNDASGDKDLAEIQHYTLTMDKANRYAAVFEDLKATFQGTSRTQERARRGRK